jgi:hypothetical protein
MGQGGLMDDWNFVFVRMDNTKKFKPVASFASEKEATEYFAMLNIATMAYIVRNNEIIRFANMGAIDG